MARPPEPLTEADVEYAFNGVVTGWQLEALDTRWGTADVVRYLKNGGNGSYGFTGAAPEGLPYSDGDNAEWWAFVVERDARGYHVKVAHEVRATGEETVLREGWLIWNRLANMATLAALERFGSSRDRGTVELEAPPGAQLSLAL